jgi:hypothetical protein
MDNQVSKPTKSEVITYSDLEHLSVSLATAVNGQLMSLEEARAIWKRHLVLVGWKKKPVVSTPVSEVVKVTTEQIKTEVKTGK